VGRIITVALVVWAILFALALSRMEGSGIYAVFQTLMAFIAAPSFALILTGILWKRATGTGAFIGFLSGLGCSVFLFILNQESVYGPLGWPPLFQIAEPFLYLSFWSFLVSMTVIVAGSLATKPEPEEKIARLVYRRAPRS
jgi:SSS family solute:Na+ symporter